MTRGSGHDPRKALKITDGATPAIKGKTKNKKTRRHTTPLTIILVVARTIRRASGLGYGYILHEEKMEGALQRRDRALPLMLVSQSSLPSDNRAPRIPPDNRQPTTESTENPTTKHQAASTTQPVGLLIPRSSRFPRKCDTIISSSMTI